MHFREANIEDIDALVNLYTAVARHEGGIARIEKEISRDYVNDFFQKTREAGFMIVCEHPEENGSLVAEIHAYKPGIAVFDHVWSDLTIVVHPLFQKKKLGRTIMTIFLDEIARNRPDIGRVELFVRESNARAIALYESLGFRIEGRFEMRIRTTTRQYEADIAMSWQNPNFEF
jgi:ribosomal protein S18 acetylase RimI-like enzyme